MTALMESGYGNGVGRDAKAHSEIVLGGGDADVLLVLGGQSDRDGDARISTSSSSSEGGFFQVEGMGFIDPAASGGVDASEHLIFPPVTNDLQLEATLEFPDDLGVMDDELDTLEDEIQPPPVQEMVRSDAPDPYRIPSSVFARTKSITPMDWSVASNESLFSIHMGNSSFSGDHFILFGKSGDSSPFPPPLPLPDLENETDPHLTTEELNAEAMEDVLRAAADGHAEHVNPPNFPRVLLASASHRSNGSATSIGSFAFPILTAGEIRSGSVRAIPDKQQFQAPKTNLNSGEVQNKESTPTASQRSWCFCLPCSYCR